MVSESDNRAEFLIVDTSAFIKNVNLQDIGKNIITITEVLNEIKSKRQIRRLVVLPYDLQIKETFPENIHHVTEFSKKTGDYRSLSATDLKVIALTYQLEKELIGTDHLRQIPDISKTIDICNRSAIPIDDIAGFYNPNKHKTKKTADDDDDDDEENVDDDKEEAIENETICEDGDSLVVQDKLTQNLDSCHLDHKCELSDSSNANVTCEKSNKESEKVLLSNQPENNEDDEEKQEVEEEKSDTVSSNEQSNSIDDGVVIKGSPEKNDNTSDDIDSVFIRVKDDDAIDDEESDYGSEDYGDDDDDGDGDWITVENIKDMKQMMEWENLEEKPVKVACLTTDFAMQNVLKQMGLNVVSLDGRIIKQLRTFILRCYACFKTTSIMTKIFCPHCGNKTLKKVAVSLDKDGNQKIHINLRKPLTARGKKYSLPKPQGGKHAVFPLLCEDQPMPDQRPTRLARMKNNPLEPDYIAGFSPFMMRDVNSKSAMLGIPGQGKQVKYWMRRNPNESHRRCKKKK